MLASKIIKTIYKIINKNQNLKKQKMINQFLNAKIKDLKLNQKKIFKDRNLKINNN